MSAKYTVMYRKVYGPNLNTTYRNGVFKPYLGLDRILSVWTVYLSIQDRVLHLQTIEKVTKYTPWRPLAEFYVKTSNLTVRNLSVQLKCIHLHRNND